MTDKNEKDKKILNRISNNIILATGLLFLILGIFLLVLFTSDLGLTLHSLRPLLFLIIGGVILYYALIKRREGWIFFPGLFLFLTGILYLLIDLKISQHTIDSLWPVMVINCGIAVLCAGIMHTGRIKLVILIPSTMIILLGVIFLLFSLDIITKSFSSLAAIWWPVILILGGIGLLIVFFMENKFSKNSSFEKIKETENDDFSDVVNKDL